METEKNELTFHVFILKQLGATGGKYKFLLDGSLQIIGLVRSDAGIYVCSAENGVGTPVEKSFNLKVLGMYFGFSAWSVINQ